MKYCICPVNVGNTKGKRKWIEIVLFFSYFNSKALYDKRQCLAGVLSIYANTSIFFQIFSVFTFNVQCHHCTSDVRLYKIQAMAGAWKINSSEIRQIEISLSLFPIQINSKINLIQFSFNPDSSIVQYLCKSDGGDWQERLNYSPLRVTYQMSNTSSFYDTWLTYLIWMKRIRFRDTDSCRSRNTIFRGFFLEKRLKNLFFSFD